MFRDGPLSRRPPEEIRYGTGKCPLGRVLVASSERGIVTIMVRDTQARLLQDLRARFPKAELIRDEKGCAPELKEVVRYIGKPAGVFPQALDIRGTELQKRVWAEVRKIPFGKTSTYTEIAAAIGAPKAIRAVAGSCARSWFAFAVPCHRVLHKGGATAQNRRAGRQYNWVDYEAKLVARRRSRSDSSQGKTRMPAYWIARSKITEPVAYKKYTDRVPGIISKFGGKVLARGGKYRIMEGPEKFQRFVVIEFASLEQAVACFESPDYQEAAAFRRAGAGEVENVIVEGGDATIR